MNFDVENLLETYFSTLAIRRTLITFIFHNTFWTRVLYLWFEENWKRSANGLSRRTRKRVLGDKSRRMQFSLTRPPASVTSLRISPRRYTYSRDAIVAAIAAAVHNERLLLQCARLQRRPPLLHRPSPSYWYIFRRFSVHAVKGPRRRILTSWTERRTTPTRCTVNRSRDRALPPGEEGRERYLRHVDSAWTNRKYDVAPSPPRPTLPLSLSPFFSSSSRVSPFLFFASNIYDSGNKTASARRRLVCKIHLNLTHERGHLVMDSALEWLLRRLDFVDLDAQLNHCSLYYSRCRCYYHILSF